MREKLSRNQRTALRNTRHEYLLRGLVSCGVCRLTAGARTTTQGYDYYVCRGRTDKLRISEGRRCTTRYIPAEQLDELVWEDLREVLMDREQVAAALERAQGGEWLPQELQVRRANLGQAMAGIERQNERLLEAYLGEVLQMPEFERKRRELERRMETLRAQQEQLEALARQRVELGKVADSIEEFCRQVRSGLDTATFDRKRALVELLIDHVVVTDEEVEIRYVVPTSQSGSRYPFCHLRLDYRRGVPCRGDQGCAVTGVVTRMGDGVASVATRKWAR